MKGKRNILEFNSPLVGSHTYNNSGSSDTINEREELLNKAYLRPILTK